MRTRPGLVFAPVLAPVLAGALALLPACGDVYADPDGDTVPTAASTIVPKTPDTPPMIPCPRGRARENSGCATPGIVCEYGESPDRQCNSTLACNVDAAGFSVWEPRPVTGCSAQRCTAGSDIASLDGKPCTLVAGAADADELLCNMTDGVCACTTGAGGADVHERRWVCVRPSSTSCPTSRPLAGQACVGGLYCDYGGCAFKRGVVMECKGGVWSTSGAKCNP